MHILWSTFLTVFEKKNFKNKLGFLFFKEFLMYVLRHKRYNLQNNITKQPTASLFLNNPHAQRRVTLILLELNT